jgi:hypothetical protein
MAAPKKSRGRPAKKSAPAPEKPSVAAAVERMESKDKPAGEAAPKSAAERQREYRERKRDAARPPDVAVEWDAAGAGELGSVVWDIVGPYAHVRPLDEEQKARLGRALVPLVTKYAPLIGPWQVEIAALLCIMALGRECYVPPLKSGEPDEAEPAAEVTP